VRASDQTEVQARLACIERLIERYREARLRRLMRRAMRVWRQAEAHRWLMSLEAAPDRVH